MFISAINNLISVYRITSHDACMLHVYNQDITYDHHCMTIVSSAQLIPAITKVFNTAVVHTGSICCSTRSNAHVPNHLWDISHVLQMLLKELDWTDIAHISILCILLWSMTWY